MQYFIYDICYLVFTIYSIFYRPFDQVKRIVGYRKEEILYKIYTYKIIE